MAIFRREKWSRYLMVISLLPPLSVQPPDGKVGMRFILEIGILRQAISLWNVVLYLYSTLYSTLFSNMFSNRLNYL